MHGQSEVSWRHDSHRVEIQMAGSGVQGSLAPLLGEDKLAVVLYGKLVNIHTMFGAASDGAVESACLLKDSGFCLLHCWQLKTRSNQPPQWFA